MIGPCGALKVERRLGVYGKWGLGISSWVGFPGGSDGKESACNAGDLGLIPGLGRSPGGGHGNPLQYSCLENPHGQRRLAGYSPWGRKESDMTEQLSTAQYSIYGLKNMKLVQEVKTNRQIEWNGNLRGERKTIEYQGT